MFGWREKLYIRREPFLYQNKTVPNFGTVAKAQYFHGHLDHEDDISEPPRGRILPIMVKAGMHTVAGHLWVNADATTSSVWSAERDDM